MTGTVDRYTKKWRLDRARIGTRLIDAAPTRRHLELLEASGWTSTAVAKALGLSQSMVHRVRRGQPTLKRIHATRILGFIGDGLPDHPTQKGDGALIPNTGAVRRVQALLALGWPHHELQARSGINTAAVTRPDARFVVRRTHNAIRALYAELYTKPGPSQAVRRRAAAHGYFSPIYWDDIDHDPTPIRNEREVS